MKYTDYFIYFFSLNCASAMFIMVTLTLCLLKRIVYFQTFISVSGNVTNIYLTVFLWCY